MSFSYSRSVDRHEASGHARTARLELFVGYFFYFYTDELLRTRLCLHKTKNATQTKDNG